MTSEEKKLWMVLRKNPTGLKFKSQYPFRIYVLVFYCHQEKLSIEIDDKGHDNAVQKEYEKQRMKYLSEFGIKESDIPEKWLQLVHSCYAIAEMYSLQSDGEMEILFKEEAEVYLDKANQN